MTNITPTEQQASQATRLIELAISQNADIDKLDRLMQMQQRWDAEQARKAYFAALSAFQSDVPAIKKQKSASFGQGKTAYSYASLDDISETIKPYLTKHGISYRFEQRFEGQAIVVACVVTHVDGHSERCEMFGGSDTSGSKNAIQAAASTITYLRRYTLTGALGIATADADIDGRLPDDGERQQAQQQARQAQPITDQRLTAAIAKINAGEYSVAALNAHFALTPEQSERVSRETAINGGDQ